MSCNRNGERTEIDIIYFETSHVLHTVDDDVIVYVWSIIQIEC